MIHNSDFKGKQIGNYQILESLGAGGMAVIYKAKDVETGKFVAVKFLQPAISTPDLAIRRFEREVRALTKLSHPDIVRILNFGQYDGLPYLVMDYLPGGTLKQKKGKPVEWRTAAGILLPVAKALNYAHQNGITHRDVKPANILFSEDGQARLADFGVAKLTDGEDVTTDLTGTGRGVGTPDYMAPEQFDGISEPGVDIYAFGVVFYELVTGRKPYTAGTPSGVILKKNIELPVSPASLVKDLPVEVNDFMMKMLHIDYRQRYQSMKEVMGIVGELSVGRLPALQKTGIQKPVQWTWIVAGLALLTVMGASSFAVFKYLSQNNQDPQQPASVEITDAPVTESLPQVNEPVVVIPDVSASSNNLIFHDDFSDFGSGWDSGSNSEFLTDYEDGGYRIWINSKEKTAWSTPGLNIAGDVQVEVFATKRGGPDNNAFGLICRHTRGEKGFSFYFFYITSQGGAAIGKYVDSQPEFLANTAEPIREINTDSAANRIDIECVGDKLYLYANGVAILGATDSTLKEGDVGLIARTFKEIGTDILFDNFSVAMP